MKNSKSPTTVLVCHGAWCGGWQWKKMHSPMREAGYQLVTPTITGLGDRAHLARRDLDVESAVQDMLKVIHFEDLDDIVLIGHSFGGMIATGVADRLPAKVTQLIYLDAFVPRDGESLFDLNERLRDPLRNSLQSDDAWLAPPLPLPMMSPDASKEVFEWEGARAVPMPLNYFESKIRLQNGEPKQPRSYIRCTYPRANNPFEAIIARAKSEAGWTYHELYAGHTPNLTAPEKLTELLHQIIAGRGAQG